MDYFTVCTGECFTRVAVFRDVAKYFMGVTSKDKRRKTVTNFAFLEQPKDLK